MGNLLEKKRSIIGLAIGTITLCLGEVLTDTKSSPSALAQGQIYSTPLP